MAFTKVGVGTSANDGTGDALRVAMQTINAALTLLDNLSGGTSQGSWAATDGSGAGLTITTTRARYVKIGSIYLLDMTIVFPATANGSNAIISGLPASFANASNLGIFALYDGISNLIMGIPVQNTATFGLYTGTGVAITNATLTSGTIRGQFQLPTV